MQWLELIKSIQESLWNEISMSLCKNCLKIKFAAATSSINDELILLAMSVYGGLVLTLCYDAIRIFRRIFKASPVRVIVEDVIFWTVAAIFMFDILLKYNYGRLRYFVIIAMLGSMMLFEWIIGRRMVDKVAKLIRKISNTLLKPLKNLIGKIKLKTSKKFKNMRKKVNVWSKTEKRRLKDTQEDSHQARTDHRQPRPQDD